MKKRPFSLKRGIPVKNHLRFLRPGALARIRDSKLTSLSIHNKLPLSVLVSPIPPSPPHEADTQQPAAADQRIDSDDSSPCFLGKRAATGPACPQRKKLCAAKYVFFLPPLPSPNLETPVVDLLGSDLVAAH